MSLYVPKLTLKTDKQVIYDLYGDHLYDQREFRNAALGESNVIHVS